MGNQATFLANEQKVFEDVAKWMKSVGLQPNRNTVRLHQEFSATSCPHRSWALHGSSINAVKDYYITQILKKMNGSSSSSSSSSSSTSNSSNLVKNPKPLTNGKVGDTVKIYDALYTTADGGGRSTAARGKTGTIEKILPSKGKKYHVKGLGWAHPNDLQLVTASNSKPSYFTNVPASKRIRLIAGGHSRKTSAIEGADWDKSSSKVKLYGAGTVLMVKGMKKTKGGTPRFVLDDGTLFTANKANVKAYDFSEDYYTSNPGKVRLKISDGLRKQEHHSEPNWSKYPNSGGKYPKGTVFIIKGIKHSKSGVPRLLTQSGYLLTANRKCVEKC